MKSWIKLVLVVALVLLLAILWTACNVGNAPVSANWYLFVANSGADTISGFLIDKKTGAEKQRFRLRGLVRATTLSQSVQRV
jgi:hypothetical protein